MFSDDMHSSPDSVKQRHGLHMRCVGKHIHDASGNQSIAQIIDQHAGIPRQ
jgi:hypothetical protein